MITCFSDGCEIGGFHSHGGTPIAGWMIYFLDNPLTRKWMITGASPMTKRKPPPVLKLPTSPKETNWVEQQAQYIEGENQTRNANINGDFDFWDIVGLQPIYNVCFCGNS